MRDYCKLVNIDLGTDSTYRESNGNTLPNVQYPFGNQAYVMQTNKANGGWFYEPRANYTEGVRISNQPSPWLGDYGHMTIMPFKGKYNIDLHSSITNKELYPHNMKFTLNRFNIDFELVPARYGAVIVLNSKSDEEISIELDCHETQPKFKVIANRLFITLEGGASEELGADYRKFYCIDINKGDYQSLKAIKCNRVDNKLVIDTNESDIRLHVASSYISYEYARFHVEKMIKSSFEELKGESLDMWNQYLGKVEIEEDEESQRLFYSNLYRCLCYPRRISEVGIDGQEVFYNFKNKTIESGAMIADCGFWDTYRTTIPMYKLIYPEVYKTIVYSILNYYKGYEWLPRWLAPYERGIMPSTLVDSVVATAIIDQTIDNQEDIELAIEALLKNATTVSDNELFGRKGLDEYIKNGYIASSDKTSSVTTSLDYYYCDYAVYKALAFVGHERAAEFKSRAMEYKQLFNSKSKLFEPKDKEGQFITTFNPIEWGTDFCESSAYQNNFNLVYDVKGMISLFGGATEVKTRLDFLMESEPKYDVGKYGFEIHEMTELARVKDLGYFAISNQPSFGMPFWYLQIGENSSFEQIISKTMQYFTSEVNGYPGDEDNGSLAAWFVLVSIGKYPFCPVDGFIEFKPRYKYFISN